MKKNSKMAIAIIISILMYIALLNIDPLVTDFSSVKATVDGKIMSAEVLDDYVESAMEGIYNEDTIHDYLKDKNITISGKAKIKEIEKLSTSYKITIEDNVEFCFDEMKYILFFPIESNIGFENLKKGNIIYFKDGKFRNVNLASLYPSFIFDYCELINKEEL